MLRFTVKWVIAPLCAALVVGLLVGTSTHADIQKAFGETSTATANCSSGCSLSMRLMKGSTLVKDDVVSGVPWTWLDTWGTGTFTVECKCGDAGWHTIQTYHVVRFNLPIVSEVASEDSPISVWLPANFDNSAQSLRVWTYPHPDDNCYPWNWSNATLWSPKGYAWNYSEAYVSSDLGTRLVSVTAMLNGQEFGYGERQVTMAEQMAVTGLGGDPGTWSPDALLKPIFQTDTHDVSEHFGFSTTVTSTVHETETGQRTFAVAGTDNDSVPTTMTASVECGVYDVLPSGGSDSMMQSLEAKVGYDIENSRTLTTSCSLSVDVPANKRLTVLLGPLGQRRDGAYTYYMDQDINGAAESKEAGTYDAVKVSGVHLDYTTADILP